MISIVVVLFVSIPSTVPSLTQLILEIRYVEVAVRVESQLESNGLDRLRVARRIELDHQALLSIRWKKRRRCYHLSGTEYMCEVAKCLLVHTAGRGARLVHS